MTGEEPDRVVVHCADIDSFCPNKNRLLCRVHTITSLAMMGLISAHVANAEIHPSAETVPETGRAIPGLEPFDRLMESFVAEHNIPGASLAVGRDNRLLYSRAFGYADVETLALVQPDSLFRIASISKPITAMAVMRLIEEGRLELDTPMMRYLNPKLLNEEPADEQWKKITVRHLLQHRGGWDRNQSFDPMFRSRQIVKEMESFAPADPAATIRYMARRKLDFSPGERYAYSNFGYCLLGRIIEFATKSDYESSVKQLVLDSIDSDGFLLGRTEWGYRSSREVVYHTGGPLKSRSVFREERVKHPYGAWCLETMDAHGGWLATAPALVRFACQTLSNPPVLIREQSFLDTIARPEGLAGREANGKPKAAYYGFGWMVRPVESKGRNLWHGGSLPGTCTLLVRRFDGITWAVLFNTRDIPGPRDPAALIDPLLHRAADEVTEWPEHDLWQSETRAN